MRIDPRLLIEFATVAEEGSFTKAALRMRIAQPWLSARVRRLEGHLGFRLLRRTTRLVTLTARGAEMLEAAKAVAAAANAAGDLALRLRGDDAGLLRIGAAPYTKDIAERRAAIDEFTARSPNVSLEIETGWSLSLQERLRLGNIDLSFMMGRYDATAFEGLLLKRLGMAITMSRGHPLARRPFLVPADLGDLTIQVFTRGLNPALWEDLYAPLQAFRSQFIEIPQLAEGNPDYLARPDSIMAFFDLEADAPPTADIVRVPLRSPEKIAFSLLRRRGEECIRALAFWRAAERAAALGDSNGYREGEASR